MTWLILEKIFYVCLTVMFWLVLSQGLAWNFIDSCSLVRINTDQLLEDTVQQVALSFFFFETFRDLKFYAQDKCFVHKNLWDKTWYWCNLFVNNLLQSAAILILLSSILVRRKCWFWKRFKLCIFNGFNLFGMSWAWVEYLWKMSVCVSLQQL